MRIQRFSPSSLFCWARQLFLGIPPFISDPGNLCRSFASPPEYTYVYVYFFCIDGSIALLSSSLTGQIWDGLIWVFSNYSELNDVAKETMSILGYAMPSGGSDVVWINDDTIATANDNGEVGFNDLRKLLFCNVMFLFLKVVQK